jgi:hypothetical protein
VIEGEGDEGSRQHDAGKRKHREGGRGGSGSAGGSRGRGRAVVVGHVVEGTVTQLDCTRLKISYV